MSMMFRSAPPHALVLVSVCVGAMVVARALDDPLANAFRKAARKHVLGSSGWGYR
jgi:hypothetical protein